MTVTEGVAVDEVEQLFETVVAHAAQAPFQAVGAVAVEGEDVDVAAAKVIEVAALDKRRAVVLDFAERQRIGRVVFGAHELEMLGQPLLAMLDKALIIRAWHRAVKVVVPGYESAVADGAEQRAAADAIAQIVLAAHLVEGDEDFQQPSLQLFYVIFGHIVYMVGLQ